MTRSSLFILVAALAGALVVGGCTGVRKQLGLTKQPPDEFRVVAHAPLTMPPDMNLRPPVPGVPRPQEGTPRQQARQTVVRVDGAKEPAAVPVAGADGRSLGEQALLRQAGADQTDSSVRQRIDEETQRINEDNVRLIDRLVFWRDAAPPGEVVDAVEEAKRLRKNAALGKPPSEGEVPTIERKNKALLEGIF